jgi:L,D-transpeptidase YcbB
MISGALRLCAVATMLLGLVFAGSEVAQALGNEKVAHEIEAIIKNGESNIGSERDDQRLVQVYTFYFDRDFKPVWTRDAAAKSKARELLAIMKRAEQEGLDPAWYRVREIDDLIDETDPRGLAELDMLVTRAFIDYARDLQKGRVSPSEVDSENATAPLEIGAATLLDGAEQAESIAQYVQTLQPGSDRYQRMRSKLAELRKIEAKGGWPTIPAGSALKPGGSDGRLPAIRDYLVMTGDLGAADRGSGDRYDEKTVEAVKRFQERHGLTQDGIIGGTTLSEMQVSVDRRVRQMEVNMERRRWMNRDPGDLHIFVNLADQYLKVVKDEKTIHTALLVVGKPFTRTPIFSEKMTYVVFNPYWSVPPSIANKEYLVKLRQDPGILNRQKIRVLAGSGDKAREIDPYSVNWSGMSRIPYALRQDPGKGNSLGRLKFMFPNKYNVYIHDTPAKALFSKDLRVYSHGCMRVQHPEALAEVLLKAQGWTKEKIDAQLATGAQKIVNLKTSIPVHVTYLTAWVNKDGTVNFRRDVYKRDQRLMEAMYHTEYLEH